MSYLKGAERGLSRMALALGGAGGIRQQAFDDEVGNQSKMALALEQAREAAAKADQTGMQTDLMRRRPELMELSTALSAGTDVPTLRAFQQLKTTGQLPQIELPGPTMDGSRLTGADPIPEDIQTRLAQALGQRAPLMANTGDVAPSAWAEALTKLRDLNQTDEIIGGASPTSYGRAMNAQAGRAEFQIPNTYTGNQFTGAVDMAQPINAAQIAKAEQPDPNKPFMYVNGKIVPNQAYQQYARGNAEAGAPRVTVDQRQPNAFKVAQGKEWSDAMASMNSAALSAPARLQRVARMEALLDGVDGGKLAPLGKEVASFASSLGIKIDPQLGNKEASEALSIEMALAMRPVGSGPMTDKDFENFLLTVPNLSKTAEGRKQITLTMRAAIEREVKVAKMARDYVKRKGQLDDEFLDEAAQFIAENPVVQAPTSANPIFDQADAIIRGGR